MIAAFLTTSATYFLMTLTIFAIIALAFCVAWLWSWFKPVVAIALTASLALAAALVPGIAWAQAAADAASPAAAGAAILPDIQQITGSAAQGKWALALVLALGLGIRFFRGPVLNMLPDTNAVKVWVKGTMGGWVVNIVGSELAALATALMAGPVTAAGIVSALLGGVMVSFGAAGFHEFTKDVGAVPATPPPAPVLNATQAASVLELPPKDK